MYKRKTNRERGMVQLHLDVPVDDHRLIRTVAAARGQTVMELAAPLVVDFFRSEAARLGVDQLGAPATVAAAQ